MITVDLYGVDKNQYKRDLEFLVKIINEEAICENNVYHLHCTSDDYFHRCKESLRRLMSSAKISRNTGSWGMFSPVSSIEASGDKKRLSFVLNDIKLFDKELYYDPDEPCLDDLFDFFGIVSPLNQRQHND